MGKQSGFTIVELLIVIVVIGILAAIVIVAYNGVQTRARDALRKDSAVKIVKALEQYYNEKGTYPVVADPGVPSTDPAFLTQLKPYMGNVPVDPSNNSTNKFIYRYFVPNYIFNGSTGCKAGDYLSTGVYYLQVTLESANANPFPNGSGALATDQTRCGSNKFTSSSGQNAFYLPPSLTVQ